MLKLAYFYGLLVVASLLFLIPPPAQAQGANSICIWAHEDSNENGTRDAGELYIGGVAANLASTEIILQSKVTGNDNTPVCFEGLGDGLYTVEFVYGERYRPTTENKTEFSLSNGARMRVEFGAVPLSVEEIQAAEAAENDGGELTITRRLVIAGVGSSALMLLMMGLGLLIGAYRYF